MRIQKTAASQHFLGKEMLEQDQRALEDSTSFKQTLRSALSGRLLRQHPAKRSACVRTSVQSGQKRT